MSKIYCLTGKSGSGKDTLYAAIMASAGPELRPVTPCTTRPRRSGEKDGDSYFFVTDSELAELESRGLVVERRVYNTVHGPWTYFTRKFDLIEGENYLLITTLEGARSFIGAFGRERVEIVYLQVADKLRLTRCVERESAQSAPDYREVCRRYLADEVDFSPEKIAALEPVHIIDSSRPLPDCLRRWREIYTLN